MNEGDYLEILLLSVSYGVVDCSATPKYMARCNGGRTLIDLMSPSFCY